MNAENILTPAEIEAITARDKAYGEGEHEPPQDIAIDRARLLRHLAAMGSAGTVVAEVVAMLPRLRDEQGGHGTADEARKDIARELAEAPVGRFGFTVIAGLAIQGALACDAKGGA